MSRLTLDDVSRWLKKLDVLESEGTKLLHIKHLLQQFKTEWSQELIAPLLEDVLKGKYGTKNRADLIQRLERILEPYLSLDE